MDISLLTKPRYVRKINTRTPLIVPSFSSTVHDNISEFHDRLKESILDASLISAYDIFNNKLIKENIWCSEVVFIDSGCYELDVVKKNGKDDNWSLKHYEEVVSGLTPQNRSILVSYDQKASLREQVTNAKSFFDRHDRFASDFLYKPSDGSSNLLDITALANNISHLDGFGLLGVTEKELGASILKRCENLLNIRDAMEQVGLSIPIHIFGCIDPLSIIVYFLCGADVFDGLAWLKYSFKDHVAIYANDYAILSGWWSDTVRNNQIASIGLNLREMWKLMAIMNRFAQNHDFKLFGLDSIAAKQVKALVSTAGVKLEVN